MIIEKYLTGFGLKNVGLEFCYMSAFLTFCGDTVELVIYLKTTFE
jgi:hypothetical protein